MNNYKKHKKYERGDVIGEQGQLCAECNFRQYIGEVSGVGGEGFAALWHCIGILFNEKVNAMVLVLFGAFLGYVQQSTSQQNAR